MPRALLLSLILLLACLLFALPLPSGERGVDIGRIDGALASGRRFLLDKQGDDGAWRSEVYGPFKDGGSLTPLVLRALFGLPSREPSETARIDRGIAYLMRMVQPDGSIDAGRDGLAYPVYTVSNAVVVLSRSSDPKHLAARNVWLAELRRRQLTEDLGWLPTDTAYGGWSYSSRPPVKPASGQAMSPLDVPNLSATVFALDALRAAGCPANDPAIRKALRFVLRCQNFSDEDVAEETSGQRFDDGGFFFIEGDPVRNKAGSLGRDRHGCERFASYGSTTADGLRALLACGVAADDPRVAASRRWLESHFVADSHPGGYAADREHARNALYFYYARSTALAFAAARMNHVSKAGGQLDWPAALASELIRRQRDDGSWSNPVVAVREDDPLVATSFALEALTVCRSVMSPRSEVIRCSEPPRH